MAEKRMFSKTIIDSDVFLDMPLSTQALYFHLSMRADDEGFVNNPKKIQKILGASDDDAKILLAKKFIISFESGVIVIKHWKIHNYIQKDRFKATNYNEERELLAIDKNNLYTLYTKCIQNGNTGKVSIELGKVNIEEDSNSSLDKSNSAIQKKFQKPTLEEIKNYIQAKHFLVNAETFFSYYDANGWMIGKNPMKSWKSAISYWHTQNKSKPKQPQIGSYDHYLQQQECREIIDVEV